MVGPGFGIADRLLEQVLGHLGDIAGIFGDGDESLGREHASYRVLPACEDLESDRLRGREIDERLIVGNDLTRLDGARDLGFELDPLLQLLVHGSVEEAIAASPFGLRPIHGHVGLAQCRVDGVLRHDRPWRGFH
jgi:hypothetical protein